MENVDFSILGRRIESIEDTLKRLDDSATPRASIQVTPALFQTAGQSGGNGGDGMDNRIINLERDMTDVKVALGKVETRLENIEKAMLTKGQSAIYLLVAGIAIFGAGWWVVQQYLAPLVAGLPK